MSAPLAMRIRMALQTGPRKPEAFPDSGKDVLLLTCPRCRQKGLLCFNAPHERGYPTKCIKCGVPAVIKPREISLHDLQVNGGFTPVPDGMRPRFADVPLPTPGPAVKSYDATRHFEMLRAKAEHGSRGAQRRGFLPDVKNERLRRVT